MKTTKINDTVYQLTRMGAFNCFIVDEGDELTLVDTGLPNSADAILEIANSVSKPVSRIVLTHAHQDHIGSLDALVNLLPDVEVAAPARSLPLLKKDLSTLEDEPQDKLRGSYTGAQTVPSVLISDGMQLGTLKAVSAPGHTPDHFAYLETQTNTLLAGDAFQTKAKVAVVNEFTLLFPFPSMATWHKPTALESAQRLTDLKPDFLAVGHGNAIAKPVESMQNAIDRIRR